MEEFFLKSKKTAGHYRIKRKLDEKLKKLEIPTISREKVKLITAKLCLVSKYIKRKRKNPDNVVGVNNNDTQNLLDLKFNHYKPMQAIVSDTTYFKIYIHNKKKFVYGCIVMDLWNREIIGFSTFTEKKDSNLVLNSLSSIKYSLKEIEIYHTDCGKEFDNNKIDKFLDFLNIKRSLNKKRSSF